ncbi:hypothetical protein [Nitrosomonas eutropha]|uniref:Formylmethanofuran dehydrogenase subunit E domain-containing protein n=2 Tax=Nitrosomonas eutropha TaxID=916 RepID=A0ABX5M870_9PROT|nr:hypothetical protein [Nitrosomonas eutropha]ABI60450.1 conserved hypothetical protein [Nitrosomonas eutropha C91]PXV77782.1 hypothetical protein C8R14_12619 [Nitrosomonas eutropha]SEJ17266.1 hypothetical protein SAMN05216318_12913 [Nitrosomonas eutropha]
MDKAIYKERFPDFFADAPAVTLRDPLAQFLGTARDGIMEYRYADAVRLAGHSCPTVAGTWLMTLHGLRALYGNELPVRGEIEVYMADARDAGTTGVVATVVQLVTGAAPETGFHGIGGRFGRNNLLHFDQPLQGEIGLRRKDTGAAVQVVLDASVVPWPNEMRQLLPKAVSGQASSAELQYFGELWQERVRQMLIEHAGDANLVQVNTWVVN